MSTIMPHEAGFPATFTSHAAEAVLYPSQVITAYAGGPGTVIVYSCHERRYRVRLAEEARDTTEPDEVLVCGHGDIEIALEHARAAGLTLRQMTRPLAQDCRAHLEAWADVERLAGLPPVLDLRRDMARSGFHLDRCSHLGTCEGARTTQDFFAHLRVPTVMAAVRHRPLGEGRSEVRGGLYDIAAEFASWDAPVQEGLVRTRANEITAALYRYLGR
ncbi:hypothetical protein [Streptomonospora litoralis]|uniref:Uncharacterized protein n=1 Tax=Streptomonospora litoralis TaxID=2498135 RepID=A0A4P6Q467_9ACTN|nr:hypothetical protein [Streptomonospora litoralis]QBI55486.1 hypothetical protein EKD16_18610 [Streptomonospora litoralis]